MELAVNGMDAVVGVVSPSRAENALGVPVICGIDGGGISGADTLAEVGVLCCDELETLPTNQLGVHPRSPLDSLMT